MGADFRVYDVTDNGEFLTSAKVDLILDGEVVETHEFWHSMEDGRVESAYGSGDATSLALSCAHAWVESRERSLEQRVGRYGVEWEREARERFEHGVPF